MEKDFQDAFALLEGEITAETLAKPEFDKQFSALLAIEEIVSAKVKYVKDKLKGIAEEQYNESGDTKIESLSYNVTYKAAYTRNGLDNEKLEREYPQAFKDCQKTTICSSSIKVTRKRGK